MKKKQSNKLPKKLILNGEIYKIIIAKAKKDKLKGAIGKIDFSRKEITIDCPEENQVCTLLHEVSHYFADYYGIEDSEAFAEGLSRFIINVIIIQILKNEI